jgi:DNA-directed RNA polymerase subunit beta'
MLNAKNLKEEKGGLFDVNLTGGIDGTKWSHMNLVEPVVNPVFEEPVRRLLGLTKRQLAERIGNDGGAGIKRDLNKIDLVQKEKDLIALTKTKRGTELDNAVKQLGYVKSLQAQGHTKAGDVYIWSKIPIIPPVFRPAVPSQTRGELQINDANFLYRDVALASEALKGHVEETELPDEIMRGRHNLYSAVAALVGTAEPTSPQLKGRKAKGFIKQITGVGSPKTGFVHKRILKRQQDLSGRATATPDNTLNMDQIGIPEDMLWTMYHKFIMKGLINQGYTALRAKEAIEEQTPAAKAVLQAEIVNRPVFVNRAPSLHKHNVVSAYAVPTPGKSLRVNPFMEQGQNLDYDGDAMQLHVPVSPKAVTEAQNLTLSKLLFSDKNREALMIFPQHEAILGTWMATAKKEKGPARKFKNTQEAMEAYTAGKITANTPVKIG